MRWTDFLNDGALRLPLRRQANGRHPEPVDRCLERHFGDFRGAIEGLDSSLPAHAAAQRALRDSGRLATRLLESVREQLAGRTSAALDHLGETLADLGIHESPLVRTVPGEELRALFRTRENDVLPHWTARELFHLPLHLRHQVSPQRYSAAGLPCLYLGSTSLVCWHEIGRPPFHRLVTARFESRKDLRVLDLAHSPTSVFYRLGATYAPDEDDPLLEGLVRWWPLLAACSVVVHDPEAPFKPEYVVPQLMSRWFLERSSLDALRYFSTRLAEEAHPAVAVNYMVPSRTGEVDEHGHYRDLVDTFAVTDPMPWDFLDLLPHGQHGNTVVGSHSETVRIVGSRAVIYSMTRFWYYDARLCYTPAVRLT